MRPLSLLIACGAVVLGMAACGGDSPASPSPSPSPAPSTPAPPSATPAPSTNTGRLFIRPTAGTYDPAKALLVTIARVRL
jgi:ABC-type glycerol-3-phosphate transport system substrate-binding protein